jgi:hypothetical protein
MSAFARGILDRYKTAGILVKGGASLPGIMLYPLRHRLPVPRHQIDLKIGLSIVSPMEEPLVRAFEDIWVNQCYTPSGFTIVRQDTVVDIGANLGVFSMWAATRAEGVRVILLRAIPADVPFPPTESLQKRTSASGRRPGCLWGRKRIRSPVFAWV